MPTYEFYVIITINLFFSFFINQANYHLDRVLKTNKEQSITSVAREGLISSGDNKILFAISCPSGISSTKSSGLKFRSGLIRVHTRTQVYLWHAGLVTPGNLNFCYFLIYIYINLPELTIQQIYIVKCVNNTLLLFPSNNIPLCVTSILSRKM